MTVNPINAVSIIETMSIKNGTNCELPTICAIYQISPKMYPTIIVPMKPIIDPAMLNFLFLKIKLRMRNDMTIGNIITNVGTINTNNNPSSTAIVPLIRLFSLFQPRISPNRITKNYNQYCKNYQLYFPHHKSFCIHSTQSIKFQFKYGNT